MSNPGVDSPTLAERLGGGTGPDPTLIDVRTPAEFAAGHIPGAVNVPVDELRASLDELRSVLDDHRDVVLICRSGARAGQAQEVLNAAGLRCPAVLSGGIVDRERAGILGSTVAPRTTRSSGLVGGNRRPRATGSALDRLTGRR